LGASPSIVYKPLPVKVFKGLRVLPFSRLRREPFISVSSSEPFDNENNSCFGILLLKEKSMTTFFQEALEKARAEFDAKVATLAKSEPIMKIADMTKALGCSRTALCLSFRRQGINRATGRFRKQVS
jgi:hypothetical protein